MPPHLPPADGLFGAHAGVLGTVDNLRLQLLTQVGEVGAVTCHTHHQVAVFVRVLLRGQQGLPVDDIKLNVPQFQIN